MRVSEWVVCGFFAYLLVLARVRPLSATRRNRVVVVGPVCIGLVVVLSQLRLQLPMRVTRDWVPGIYLLQGYWMCGLFFRRPMLAVEDRLLRIDQWLFAAARLTTLGRRAPRVLLALRRVNRVVLDRASVRVNTFPSGHVATAVAAALTTGELLTGLLPLLLVVAGTIALATVVGRYHYTADTVIGVAIGVGGWWVARAIA